jgi:hypothetical protein
MPFIRPIELYALQLAAYEHTITDSSMAKGYKTEVNESVRKCPVCGDMGCDEGILMIDDYMFHQSTVDNATEIVRADK